MRGTVGQWHEPRPQRPVPLAGCSGAPFPGAFIIAGSDPGPRSETRRRPKATPIGAHLGAEHCRPTPVDARHGIQQGDRLVKGQGRCSIDVRSATDWSCTSILQVIGRVPGRCG
jgi:hypothetical protein